MSSEPAEIAAAHAAAEEEQNARIARKVLLALLCQPLWITRTVEAVSFVDRHTARRRISRHYVIPAEGHRPRLDEDCLVRLPVFAIPKGQFLSCDLIDERGRAVSLPPLPERSRLSAAALQELGGDLLGRADRHAFERIRAFVTAGPMSCQTALAAAEEDIAMAPLFADPHFNYLATYLANNYVVFIDGPDAGLADPPRRVIRFTLDTRFPHTRRELREVSKLSRRRPGFPSSAWFANSGVLSRPGRTLRVLLRRLGLASNPYHHFIPVDGAGSFHVDVEAAGGLAFGRRRLRFLAAGRGITYDETMPGASSRRARFLLPRDRGRGEARTTIDIRAAPGLLRNGAPVLLLGFAVLLWAVIRHYSQLEGRGPTVTLLFLIPGFVAVVTARPNEHPYVTSVLLWTRILAITPVPLGLVAALVLLTKGSSTILTIEAVLAALFGFILLLGRAIDEFKVKPDLAEFYEDDLTRIG